jgi:hypothetical protein
MHCSSTRRRRVARRVFAGLLTALSLGGAHAAGPTVVPTIEAFTAERWQQLLATERPAAVVFSTTDCAYCPAAIDALAKELRASHRKAKLMVVVMDGEGQEAALQADTHYRHADRLYTFQGNPVALRYAVDPHWRGMTPYVALIARHGAPAFFIGTPKREVLASTLADK